MDIKEKEFREDTECKKCKQEMCKYSNSYWIDLNHGEFDSFSNLKDSIVQFWIHFFFICFIFNINSRKFDSIRFYIKNLFDFTQKILNSFLNILLKILSHKCLIRTQCVFTNNANKPYVINQFPGSFWTY